MTESTQQTRDSIGHTDQTRDLIFLGLLGEKLKVRVVNEVHTTTIPTPLVLDNAELGSLDTQGHQLDAPRYKQSEILRRRWDWKDSERLRESPSATGTLVEGSITVNLSLDE